MHTQPSNLRQTFIFNCSSPQFNCYIQSFVSCFRFHTKYLSLTYFTKLTSFHVYPCCCKWQNIILLWLTNIPVCVFLCVSVCVYNIFIHSLLSELVFSFSLDVYYCCSVTQSCLTLCDPMDCSTPGFPVLHYLPEFAQTHVHWVGDAVQPSHLLSPPSPPALSLSQHRGLF